MFSHIHSPLYAYPVAEHIFFFRLVISAQNSTEHSDRQTDMSSPEQSSVGVSSLGVAEELVGVMTIGGWTEGVFGEGVTGEGVLTEVEGEGLGAVAAEY